jgi:hypothetical protein
MRSYIRDRYGTPERALSAWRERKRRTGRGWY